MIKTISFNILAILALFITQLVMPLEIVTRDEWGARPPTDIQRYNKSVPFVIIHHSYSPQACNTSEQCIGAMQHMQRYHQDERGWFDIGYHFGVGGDGKVYEGRGFNVVGAHAPNYNGRSIGICLIGDWQEVVPPEEMLKATQDLILYAVEQNHLDSNYTLYGHSQVRATTCPGPALFNTIKTWPHFGYINKK